MTKPRLMCFCCHLNPHFLRRLIISKKFSPPLHPSLLMSRYPFSVSETELKCPLNGKVHYAFWRMMFIFPWFVMMSLLWKRCAFFFNSFSFNSDLGLFISLTVCSPVRFLCSSKFERELLSWHFIWARFWINVIRLCHTSFRQSTQSYFFSHWYKKLF